MNHLGSWIRIAETAEKLSGQEKEARRILQIAGFQLKKAGFPCTEKGGGFEIELNEKNIYINKEETPPDYEEILRQNREMKAEIGTLRQREERTRDILRSLLNLKQPEQTDSTDRKMPEKTEEKEAVREKKEQPEKRIPESGLSPDQTQETEPRESGENPEKIQEQRKPDTSVELYERTIGTETAVREVPSLTDGPYAGYRESLRKEEFALSYQAIEIRQNNSSITTTVEVIISPLSMEEGEADIVAWVNDTVSQETAFSQNGKKSVLLHVGNIPLIVSGTVEEGHFHGKVALTKKMELEGVTVKSRETLLDGAGHIRIEDEGISVHVIPIEDRNRESGNAGFIYAILEEGKEARLGDNLHGDEVHFEYRGTELRLVARWNEGILYAAVKPAEHKSGIPS